MRGELVIVDDESMEILKLSENLFLRELEMSFDTRDLVLELHGSSVLLNL